MSRLALLAVGAVVAFTALASSTVTNAGFSTVNGDLGVSPGSAVTGFPPGKVNGTTHAAGSVGVAAAAAAPQGAASSSQPPPSEPSLEELQENARELTGDFTPPTVRIRGKRRVRSPRVARLRIVARDNRRVTDLEVSVDGRARHVTPSLDESRRKLVMRLRFRRGRHTVVAYAVDGATTSSRLARATVVVR